MKRPREKSLLQNTYFQTWLIMAHMGMSDKSKIELFGHSD